MSGTTITTTLHAALYVSAASLLPVTLTNSGPIEPTGTPSYDLYVAAGLTGTVKSNATLSNALTGIDLRAGGTFDNGFAGGTLASITAVMAGAVLGAGAGTDTLSNSGRIIATGTTSITAGTTTSSGGVGVQMLGSGTLTNGASALIEGGRYGVEADGAASVTLTNLGTISAAGASTIATGYTYVSGGQGAELKGNGTVVNGSATDFTALIQANQDAVQANGPLVTVINYALIRAPGTTGYGVYLRTGGTVINGSTVDTGATISGLSKGIEIAGGPGVIRNYGTIEGYGTIGKGLGRAIGLAAGGAVYNGSRGDTIATMYALGATCIYSKSNTATTVKNFGVISAVVGGTGASGSDALNIRAGGVVINGCAASPGTAASTAASIRGRQFGVYLQGLISGVVSTVANYGTIYSLKAQAVDSVGALRVTNGGSGATGAYLAGQAAAVAIGGPATVVNVGTISGTVSGAYGISLANGGTVINGVLAAGSGTVTNTAALISGKQAGAVYFGGAAPGTLSNYATVANEKTGAVTGSQIYAVGLFAGGSVTNGSTADTVASILGTLATAALETGVAVAAGTAVITNFGTIAGTVGVSFTEVKAFNSGSVTLTGIGTVVNAGTIAGLGGTAVLFGTATGRAADTLVLRPGAAFGGGTVVGNGSDVLELSTLASGGGTGTLSGKIDSGAIGYNGFASVSVDTGAHWYTTGKSSITSTGTLGITLESSAAFTVYGSGTLGLMGTPGSATLNLSGSGYFDVAGATASVLVGTLGVGSGAGEIYVGTNGTLAGTGTIGGTRATIVDNGLILASPSGTLTATSRIIPGTSTGTVSICAGATLDVQKQVGGITLTFASATAASSQTLEIGTLSSGLTGGPGVFGTITNFAAGDTIDLMTVPTAASSALTFNTATDVLAVTATLGGTTKTITLTFASGSGLTSGNFALTAAGNGSTDVVFHSVPSPFAARDLLGTHGEFWSGRNGAIGGGQYTTTADGGPAAPHGSATWAGGAAHGVGLRAAYGAGPTGAGETHPGPYPRETWR